MKAFTFLVLPILIIALTIQAGAQVVRKGVHSPFGQLHKPTRYSTTLDSNFSVVSEWQWGLVTGVAPKGNYVFIGNGSLIQTLDISDPSSPSVVAEYNTGFTVYDLKLKDSLLYVCAGGLQILDISNPLAIAGIGSIPLYLANQVVVTDSFAYVNRTFYGGPISIVDISDPSNPRLRSTGISCAQWPVRIAASDQRFIYASGLNVPYLTILDARNPDSLWKWCGNIGSVDVAVKDTILYLAWGNQVLFGSISDPSNPVELGYDTCNGLVQTIFVDDTTLFAFADSGLTLFSISNPSLPVQIGNASGIPPANDIARVGNMLHVATGYSYLNIDIGNLQAMNVTGQFVGGGEPNSIAIQGHYAYLATGPTGLQILDISNPLSPQRTSVYVLPSDVWTVDVKGNSAYVNSGGLWTLDVTDPGSPFVASYLPSSVSPLYDRQVKADSNRVYCLDSTITVYDITTQNNPVKLGSYMPPYPSFGLSVADTLLFVSTQSNGFDILNVSDPKNILQASSIYSSAAGILISDSLAYAIHGNVLSILDLTKAGYPEIGHVTVPNTQPSSQMSLSGHYLYVSVDSTVVVDITDITAPHIVASANVGMDLSNEPYSDYLFVCTANPGVAILRNSLITGVTERQNRIPDAFSLAQNYPNPFNPTTTIVYTLPRAEHVSLAIYDLIGRRVTSLVDAREMAGEHEVEWNASRLSSGVYFYMLSAGNQIATRKALILK